MAERAVVTVIVTGVIIMAGFVAENGIIIFGGMVLAGLSVLWAMASSPRKVTEVDRKGWAALREGKTAPQASRQRTNTSGAGLIVVALVIVSGLVPLAGFVWELGYVTFFGMAAVGVAVLFSLALSTRRAS
jgi:hypothetical protein